MGLWHGVEWAPMVCNDCSELCGSVILGEHFEGKYKELKAHQIYHAKQREKFNL
jgi:hypothetical protein